MPPVITQKLAPHYAGLELNALVAGGALPLDWFGGAQVARTATPIFDINGEMLFYRVPLRLANRTTAWADVAAFEGFGAVLLATSRGFDWNPEALIRAAEKAARKHIKGMRGAEVRFVAYSYPKVAVQFLKDGHEVVMIEVATGAVVPPAHPREPGTPPGNFERWSFIDDMLPELLSERRRALRRLLDHWDDICPPLRPPRGFTPFRIDPDRFRQLFPVKIVHRTRELHYSTEPADHFTCFELRGQQTNVWCVAASTEMVLLFYRYQYLQTRIAQELGLGTLAMPNGLPYANDSFVVTTLETLTSNALDAQMTATPNWGEFVTEIDANRPLISFIPGHSRAVAGYTSTRIFSWYTYRGLLVYDPWPPNAGVITRWENFDASTYRRTFTAHVRLVP